MNFFQDLWPGFLSKAKSIFSFNAVHASTQFNTYLKDKEKLAAVLSNPPLLKIIALQCDLFSLGQVTVKDKKGNVIEDDPFLDLIDSPNPYQSKQQFLWDFMFRLMLGTAYNYVDSAVLDASVSKVTGRKSRMYVLDNSKIEWPEKLERWKDKLIFSDDQLKEIMGTIITYRYEDGSTFTFPLSRLIVSTDLTNGMGNFFKGPSRIDALYKVITNSELALDGKNINLRFSGKFLVGSKTSGLTTTGIGADEKLDVREKMKTSEEIWPTSKDVTIKRFVDDMGALALDQAFREDFYTIGSMWNIPRDVLEAYLEGSTYENQEKARAMHAAYCLSPKGNEWMNSFERHFGYAADGRNILIGWDHLPMMGVFKKEQAETNGKNAETFDKLLSLGVPQDQANAYLGTNFQIEEAEDGANTETIKAQAELRGSVGGVQAIIEMQAGVAGGTISRESALGILIVVYGFTKEEAQQILGPENEPKQQGTDDPEGQQGAADGSDPDQDGGDE